MASGHRVAFAPLGSHRPAQPSAPPAPPARRRAIPRQAAAGVRRAAARVRHDRARAALDPIVDCAVHHFEFFGFS